MAIVLKGPRAIGHQLHCFHGKVAVDQGFKAQQSRLAKANSQPEPS